MPNKTRQAELKWVHIELAYHTHWWTDVAVIRTAKDLVKPGGRCKYLVKQLLDHLPKTWMVAFWMPAAAKAEAPPILKECVLIGDEWPKHRTI